MRWPQFLHHFSIKTWWRENVFHWDFYKKLVVYLNVFPFYVNISIGFVLVWAARLLGLCGYSFPDISGRCSPTADICSPSLNSFLPLFNNVVRAVSAEVVLEIISLCWAPDGLWFSTVWSVVVFCNVSVYCKGKILGWVVRNKLTYGLQGTYLECL